MKRKDFFQAVGGSLGATVPVFLSCGTGGDQARSPKPGHLPHSARPNIVIIMADDMGYSDIGCYGGEIETPNLDSLASGGIRFSQFYNAARCCPTRASLLTGLYPHQAGMGDMVSHDSKRKQGPYQGYLNDRCVTIAEVLGSAGYNTYMSGKWHVGNAPENWPRQRGFDRYFGPITGGNSYFEELKKRNRVIALDDTRWTPPDEGFYITDAISDHAVEFIDQQYEQEGQEKPFFMYMAYTAPHWPLHALPGDIKKYLGKYMEGWDVLRQRRYERMIELGLIDPAWPLSPRDSEVPPWEGIEDKKHWDRLMAVYAAMIDRMDQGIGRVLAKLREHGAYENTLVLFLSDNGGCHENLHWLEHLKLNQEGTLPGERGSFTAYCRPWANFSNTPFRLFKHWVHEGGNSTPLIAHWPAGIGQAGAITHQPGHIIDLMATAIELADTRYPAEHNGKQVTPPEGKSLVPIFSGQTRQEHSEIYWEHEGNRAVRQGRWKLVSADDGQWELYDLVADRTELNNLAEKNPAKLAELIEKYKAWAAKCGVKPYS
ncbi:MAG: arylsulfatase [Gemmatimonadota bacterium]|nr:arylsulfatase [Gemmatimonadota bacterium]